MKKDFKQAIEEMLTAKLIRSSKSNWCSPVKSVKKKDNSIRVTYDYIKVNKFTVKDCYPIPRIDDMIFRLALASMFTVIDLASGYYQVPMDESSKKYTAFTCEYGLFEYNVMPMGLMNSTATFQRLMNRIFDGLIGEIMFVYLDDIIIFSRTAEEHLKHVKIIVERLRKHGLQVKLEKYKEAQRKIEFLSHVIENGTVRPSPKKVEAIANLETPKTVKQLQAFIGMASYYRKFIDMFSAIISILTFMQRSLRFIKKSIF